MKKTLPGLMLAVFIAIIATFIENILPIHLIGASVIALFIGMGINSIWSPEYLKPGIKFTSKKLLRIGIILLGASLSIGQILEVGQQSLTLMIFTLTACFGGGYFVGKMLGLNWKVSNLISAGTGICGGSAIAAIAPVIEADDQDIAYAMSATFLFDMAMILLFPIMGAWFKLSNVAYGLWTGTAVNDTSSVVAAGYAYAQEAGDIATMVKLTRTLSIIPVVLIFAFVNIKVKQKQATEMNEKVKIDIKSAFPWFISGFLALAIINSFGIIPEYISVIAKDVSKFLMVCALSAIGLNTDLSKMKKSGAKPMLHGLIISTLVVVVSIGVIWSLGLC